MRRWTDEFVDATLPHTKTEEGVVAEPATLTDAAPSSDDVGVVTPDHWSSPPIEYTATQPPVAPSAGGASDSPSPDSYSHPLDEETGRRRRGSTRTRATKGGESSLEQSRNVPVTTTRLSPMDTEVASLQTSSPPKNAVAVAVGADIASASLNSRSVTCAAVHGLTEQANSELSSVEPTTAAVAETRSKSTATTESLPGVAPASWPVTAHSAPPSALNPATTGSCVPPYAMRAIESVPVGGVMNSLVADVTKEPTAIADAPPVATTSAQVLLPVTPHSGPSTVQPVGDAPARATA